MNRAKPIGKLLSELAVEIIESARKPTVPLADKLEAFKIVSGYHVGMTRAAKGREVDEPEGGSFEKLRTGLRAVGGGDA